MLKYTSMILQKLRLDSASRIERKETAAVTSQAEVIAETIAYSDNPSHPWAFKIGEAPKTMSVIEFAKAVGEATLEAIGDRTSMEVARLDTTNTFTANVMTPGIGEDGIETIPPPHREVSIIFDRTPMGKIYEF